MSQELSRRVDALASQIEQLTRQLDAMGLRVDDLDISLRTSRYRFSERMAIIITTIVGVIMALFTVLSGINVFYG